MKLLQKNKFKIVKSKEGLMLRAIFISFFTLVLVQRLSDMNFKIPSWRFATEINEEVSPRQLAETLKNEDPVLINVHSPYEGEIEGTNLFIEHDLIKSNKDKLPKSKSTPIVLYCQSGNMSAEALQTLRDLGYKNVSHLAGGMKAWNKAGFDSLDLSGLPSQVLPDEGYELSVTWGDIGPRLVDLGVVDLSKFEEATNLTDEQKAILISGSDEKIRIDSNNSRFVVNVLWAAGLAQKSLVYDEGPMGTDYKDEQADFASTGGWSLARGDAVDYLNKYDLVDLDKDQQRRVFEIADNVYRPCCGNNTAFPDCNHGMAALFAIELMVSKGLSDEEIYKNLLALNSFWFPTSYLTTATHFARKGTSWDGVDPKLVLGEEFSSGQGAAQIAELVGELPFAGKVGGSCGA